MNAGPDIDFELLDLVRAVDPLRDPRALANTGRDTELALQLLAPELKRSPTPGRAGHRHRPAVRAVVLAAVVAAAAFVIANLASTGHRSGVSPAQARTILAHVRDALAWPPHAIYEEETVTTNTEPDGARHTVEYHEWLGTRPPHNSRLVVIVNGKVLWEQAFLDGRRDLYDPSRNTIYLSPGVTDKNVAGCDRCSADTPQSNSALSEVEYLLNQPNVTIDRSAALNGKPAIRLTFDRGRFRYWVSARTYQPLQITDRYFPGMTRFPIARLLTGPAASPKLLSLSAEHPHATIDHRRAAFDAANRVIDHRARQTGR